MAHQGGPARLDAAACSAVLPLALAAHTSRNPQETEAGAICAQPSAPHSPLSPALGGGDATLPDRQPAVCEGLRLPGAQQAACAVEMSAALRHQRLDLCRTSVTQFMSGASEGVSAATAPGGGSQELIPETIPSSRDADALSAQPAETIGMSAARDTPLSGNRVQALTEETPHAAAASNPDTNCISKPAAEDSDESVGLAAAVDGEARLTHLEWSGNEVPLQWGTGSPTDKELPRTLEPGTLDIGSESANQEASRATPSPVGSMSSKQQPESAALDLESLVQPLPQAAASPVTKAHSAATTTSSPIPSRMPSPDQSDSGSVRSLDLEMLCGSSSGGDHLGLEHAPPAAQRLEPATAGISEVNLMPRLMIH